MLDIDVPVLQRIGFKGTVQRQLHHCMLKFSRYKWRWSGYGKQDAGAYTMYESLYTHTHVYRFINIYRFRALPAPWISSLGNSMSCTPSRHDDSARISRVWSVRSPERGTAPWATSHDFDPEPTDVSMCPFGTCFTCLLPRVCLFNTFVR